MYGTLAKGPRYLEMAEGYVTGIALDEDNQIIGYQYVSLGRSASYQNIQASQSVPPESHLL